MKLWAKVLALVAGVWLVAALIIHIAAGKQPTAASVAAYAQSIDLDTLQGAARAKAITRMEDMVNRVSYEDRQQLDHERIGRDFLHKLTPDEQGAYLDATLPTGFQQLMDSFNKMDPLKRKQIVSDALARMKEHEGDTPPAGQDPTLQQHVIDQGMKSFYKDASADTKADLAPLVEQMQVNLQHAMDHP
jgi:hypothetical protein